MAQYDFDPASDGERTLDLAAWHLQMLLTSVASFDGKIMFLTALNVAGTSALIGIVIASDPVISLISLGFVLSSVGVTLGLGALWSANLQQFPSPDEVLNTAREVGNEPLELVRRHFASIREATNQAEAQLRFRIRTMRTLLLMTPIALTIVIATAITSVT